ncbi:MAG TPA: hypothetical protein VG245_00955 [Candidatus Dormibacteraeota bacterium]|nr:hypothetical protein [Candidatus Dormibacteraeota bacterium]
MLGGAVVAGVGILTLLLRWWSCPLVQTANDRFEPGIFDLLGAVPLAYAFFAFAAGVATGHPGPAAAWRGWR